MLNKKKLPSINSNEYTVYETIIINEFNDTI